MSYLRYEEWLTEHTMKFVEGEVEKLKKNRDEATMERSKVAWDKMYQIALKVPFKKKESQHA